MEFLIYAYHELPSAPGLVSVLFLFLPLPPQGQYTKKIHSDIWRSSHWESSRMAGCIKLTSRAGEEAAFASSSNVASINTKYIGDSENDQISVWNNYAWPRSYHFWWSATCPREGAWFQEPSSMCLPHTTLLCTNSINKRQVVSSSDMPDSQCFTKILWLELLSYSTRATPPRPRSLLF